MIRSLLVSPMPTKRDFW